MDQVIYRDYIVNQRFFIYCSLATESAMNIKRSQETNTVNLIVLKSQI